MNILMLGIRASGKGTQAKLLAKDINSVHISSGDLFREIDPDSKIGKEIRSYIDNGEYVPDRLVLKLLLERLKKNDIKDGYILDGFPRTLNQAQEFDKENSFDHIIHININKDEAVHRTSGRRVCSNKSCTISYNLHTAPKPKVDGVCDKCGSTLYQREDEKPEAAMKRINKDLEEIGPLLEYYKNKGILININGEQSIEKVHDDVLKGLGIF